MKYIDNFLSDIGLTRRDMDIRFTLRGGRYRIKSFTPLWCVLETLGIAAGALGFYYFCVIMILLF